jgi:hypothetical protein
MLVNGNEMQENADVQCMQNESNCVSEPPNSNLNFRANFQNIITSDIPLPTFVDVSAQNALFFIKDLDEYFELKGIPPQCRLTIAKKAFRNESARSWILATADTFHNYGEFKNAFLLQFWNNESQCAIRCNIYQDKFNRQNGKTMSDHFLSYAVLGRHLQPQMGDQELIAALKAHYPISVQKIWVAKQPGSVEEVVSFLRQMDEIETKDQGNRMEKGSPNGFNSYNHRGNRHPYRGSDQNQARHYQVRGMQYMGCDNRNYAAPRRRTFFDNRRDNNAPQVQHRGERGNTRPGNHLNPYAPAFDQERREDSGDLRPTRPTPNQQQAN